MDSCKNCGLELIGEELLSLDDKCGKCSVFKPLWKCNNFEEALTKQPTFFLYWILYIGYFIHVCSIEPPCYVLFAITV